MKRWNIPWYRTFEIAVGCSIAIAVAMSLGLINAMSAGIIAVLSIQDTKRATLRSAVERFAAYALAMLLAYICFSLLGYNVWAFFLYLLPFALLCYLFRLQASIPICTVLVTHVWIAGQMSTAFLLNETYLMVIGTSVGIFLNLFLPSSLASIKKEQLAIETAIQRVLLDFADQLCQPEHHDNLEADYAHLDMILDSAQNKAMSLLGNTLTRDVRYYVRYVDMRIAQAAVLKRMHASIDTQTYQPIAQAAPIASLARHIADVLHEANDAVALLDQTESLLNAYRSGALPQTREEFETRALLYRVLLDIEQLLLLKKNFIETLGKEDIARFLPPVQ